MSLTRLFQPSLKERAAETGLEFEGETITFAELERRADRLAALLVEDGFETGDRLAVYLPNSVEFVAIYLAAVKLGLIFTPINVLYREREIEHILADAEPKGVFVNETGRQRLLAAAARLKFPDLHLYAVEELPAMIGRCSAEPPERCLSADAVAALVYTSGTTGRPKGAMLTHGNFAANARALVECWRLTADDRLLLALPLFHVHALGNGLHTWLAAGCRMRLLERFRKETILDEMLSFRPTVFFGVPTMYERLLEAPAEKAREIGGFMRLFVSGSAALPAATLERFGELYGHVILERYGMSETLMNLSNPYDGERRPGSVGLPLPGVSIRLADPDSGAEPVDGEYGEICIRGPNVFAGYWRDERATREAFDKDGWFRSGDLAVRSPDGYYVLKGRARELIICGGFNVYPREVEEFLSEQPGVAAAAVVGIPDPVKGEVPAAFLVARDGERIDCDAVARACRESLASFKVPRRFACVAALPRNALGKVRKHLLKIEEAAE